MSRIALRRLTRLPWLLAAIPVMFGLGVAACSHDIHVIQDGGVASDAAPDVALDAAPDVALDAAPDVALDAAPDVALDAAPDVAFDAVPDVGFDAAPDVAFDASFDAPAEARDARVDPTDVATDLAPGACRAPFDDCDALPSTGCETDTNTAPAHCGGCGRACGPGDTCSGGACVRSPVVRVSAGGDATCAVRANGRVVCWGRGESGALGDGLAVTRITPVQVAGLTDAVSVATCGQHTCAIRADGTVMCWGDNQYGQLGTGTLGGIRPTAAPVPDVTDAAEIVVFPKIATDVYGGGGHTCVRQRSGRVLCWGNGSHGQLGYDPRTLGDTRTGPRRATALPVPTLLDAVSLSAGRFSICAVRATGDVVCWGDYLPIAKTRSFTPVPIGFSNAAEVAISHTGRNLEQHIVVRTRDGGAHFRYGNSSGWNVLPGIMDAAQVALGSDFECVRRTAGTVDCSWCGTGTACRGREGPLPGIVSAAWMSSSPTLGAGFEGHVCAVQSGGVRCWGSNFTGQLGDGTRTGRVTESVAVVGLP